ncbi:hypothetical protein NVP1193O_236 [Vibrio phage 1.193.O._10N.286.52.C6]|nr:hypothetical protein NVP1193O_236 [Vibrio phage 1.193.O._10N.286.52.C6]
MQTYTVLLQTYHSFSTRPHTIIHGYVVASSPENARLQGQDDYGKYFIKVVGKLNKFKR